MTDLDLAAIDRELARYRNAADAVGANLLELDADPNRQLLDFIKTGGNYSKESPGAPIAYKLNYLKDNSPARMSETTDYSMTTCDRVSQKVRVVLNSIAVDDAGGDSGDDVARPGERIGHDREELVGGAPVGCLSRLQQVTVAQRDVVA